jgi:hypothetical protein
MAWWMKLAIACVVAVVVWCLTAISYADDGSSDRSVGKVTGVVLKDGKPLADARVGVSPARPKLAKKARGHGADSPATQPADQPRREILAQTQTDADGKFTLTGLKPGDYVVRAGQRRSGHGHQRVSVAAGQESVVEITMSGGESDPAGATTQPSRQPRQHKKFQKLGL